MAQKQTNGERADTLPFLNLMAPEIAAVGKRRFEDFVSAQTAFLDGILETNQQWLDRIQLETSLDTQFVSKLASAHSVPDAMSTYQEWTTRRFELMAEDVKHLFSDAQKLAAAGAHLWSNGLLSKRTGESTSANA